MKNLIALLIMGTFLTGCNGEKKNTANWEMEMGQKTLSHVTTLSVNWGSGTVVEEVKKIPNSKIGTVMLVWKNGMMGNALVSSDKKLKIGDVVQLQQTTYRLDTVFYGERNVSVYMVCE